MLIFHPAVQFAVVPDMLHFHPAVQFAVVPGVRIVHPVVQFAVVLDKLIVHTAVKLAIVPDMHIVHAAVQFAVVPDMLIVHPAVQFAVVPVMLIVHTAAQFAALYGARNFAASFTAPVSAFYPQPDESSSYPRRIFPLRSILNSPTMPCSLMLPLLLKPLCKTPLHFSIRDTSLTHLRHVALITELILGEDYNHEALQHVFVTTVCTSPTVVPALNSAPCRAKPTAGCLSVLTLILTVHNSYSRAILTVYAHVSSPFIT